MGTLLLLRVITYKFVNQSLKVSIKGNLDSKQMHLGVYRVVQLFGAAGAGVLSCNKRTIKLRVHDVNECDHTNLVLCFFE
jgi:hypothetical protein